MLGCFRVVVKLYLTWEKLTSFDISRNPSRNMVCPIYSNYILSFNKRCVVFFRLFIDTFKFVVIMDGSFSIYIL